MIILAYLFLILLILGTGYFMGYVVDKNVINENFTRKKCFIAMILLSPIAYPSLVVIGEATYSNTIITIVEVWVAGLIIVYGYPIMKKIIYRIRNK